MQKEKEQKELRNLASQNEWDDWFDHPATKTLRALTELRLLEAGKVKQEAFFPGDPHKTQEVLSGLYAAEAEVQLLADALDSKEMELLRPPEESDEE